MGRVTLVALTLGAVIASVAATTVADEAKASWAVTPAGGHARGRWNPRPLTPKLTAGPANIQYFGGHVISHVQVVAVMWGSNVAPEVVSGMGGFYTMLTNSPFFDWLGEYDTVGQTAAGDGMPGSSQHIYRGTFLKTITINPQNTNGSIVDTDIQTELEGQIAAGALPQPVADPEGGVNTIYMIHFPPGVSIDDGSGALSCSGYCAYHGTVNMQGMSAGVPYGVMPDCGTQCSPGGGVLDGWTTGASHELAEAVTDAEIGIADPNAQGGVRPMAWYDSSQGEIGDICENDPNAYVSFMGYTVQKIWSQRLGQCITDDPSLPVCSGTVRPCRPCTAQDNGNTCTGATPVCDVSPRSPKLGQCVACSDNTQCKTPGAPVCDASTNTCRGCTMDSDCSGATPRCSAGTGACVACLANVDCHNASTPTCDATSHGCRGCRDDADCPASQTCNTSSGACTASSCGPGGCGGLTDGGGLGGGMNGEGANGGGNGNGDTSGTSTSSGCAMAPGEAPRGFAGLVGLVLGLAGILRRRMQGLADRGGGQAMRIAFLVLSAALLVDGISAADPNAAFDRKAAVQALEGVDLAACRGKQGGDGHVSITFAPEGNASDVELDRGDFGTRAGKCIVKRFRKVRVPPFNGPPVRVGKNFRLD